MTRPPPNRVSHRLRHAWAVVLLVAALWGCGPAEVQVIEERPATIASATPAATDVLRRLGAGEQLVGISRFCRGDQPRVGDANGLDWETLAVVRPRAVAIGTDVSRLASADLARARQLGIDLLDARVVRLEDVRLLIRTLASAVGVDPDERSAAFDRELRPSREAASGPRLLVVLDPDVSFFAGPRTYIDDLIRHAGGTNALDAGFADWPTLDAETLATVEVDAVVLVVTGGDRAVTRARASWMRQRENMPAWDRVVLVTDAEAMTPGWTGVVTLAKAMRKATAGVR